MGSFGLHTHLRMFCLRGGVFTLAFVLCLVTTPLALAETHCHPGPQEKLNSQATRSATLAILDLGDSTFGRTTADRLQSGIKSAAAVPTLDRDQVRTAARGVGYSGSFNLSIKDARDLGAALGSDFLILGDAQTIRRSPSTGSIYFDSYASVFLVSARTGQLVTWERPNFRAANAADAERLLLAELSKTEFLNRLAAAIHRAAEDEQGARELKPIDDQVPLIEEAPDDDKIAAAQGLRLPRPYRRFLPPYPETAALAEAEATVDVLVDIDADGEVSHVEVARWAGFGLDQATVDTVRRLHFFPAMKNGVPIPIRVLLRYNFRKPPK